MAEAGPGRGKRHRIIERVFDFHDPSVGSTSTVWCPICLDEFDDEKRPWDKVHYGRKDNLIGQHGHIGACTEMINGRTSSRSARSRALPSLPRCST